MSQLGLSQSSKSVATQSMQPSSPDETPLSQSDSTLYRGLEARANYLAQDRSDIGFPVKELCRYMANPRQCDMTQLKRLARYLIDKTRVIVNFAYQRKPSGLAV